MKNLEFLFTHTPVGKLDSSLKQIVRKSEVAGLEEESDYQLARQGLVTKATTYTNAVGYNPDLANNKSKDQNRDRLLYALFDGIEYFKNSPVEEKAQAAARLESALRRYSKTSARKSMLAESSDINNIIAICEKPEGAALVAVLGDLSETVTALKAAELEFAQERISYDDSKAANLEQANATELRPEVLEYTNDTYLAYVYAMANIRPSVYGALAAQLAEIVKENNVDVRRASQKKEETEEGAEPTQGDDQKSETKEGENATPTEGNEPTNTDGNEPTPVEDTTEPNPDEVDLPNDVKLTE